MSINPNKNELSRRDFIKVITAWTGALMAAMMGIPSLGYLIGPALMTRRDEAVVDLGPIEKYPIGIPTRFDMTRTQLNGWERTAVNYGMFVVRTSEQDARVFSDICTHLGCRVNWHPDIGHYVSPCHDGHFDMMGNVVSGPPPRPLDEYRTAILAGRLVASLPPAKRAG
ncbi:MAG: ubiquinol-cytochrome c reductase iron-sulfur subunit [Bacteroidota bacterium]